MKPRQITFLLLFLTILLLEFALWGYLVFDRRMVLGHDGFELFSQQWYFLNAKVSHGQIPLWSPYLTQGNPTWWCFIYGRVDMFINILMLFSSWIKGINFLPLFYGALFFDKFILLTGVWLLARRYFSSPFTVFFVASTVMASTVTMTSFYFTLELFYALPLTIYLLHRFLDSWDWRWLFLTAYFVAVVISNCFYFASIDSLAVFLYFFIYYFKSFPGLVKSFRVGQRDVVWILLTVMLLLIFYLIYHFSSDPLMYIKATDRLANGGTSLNTFLSYAGKTDLSKWGELFLGTSSQIDFTVYIGVLSLPLMVLGAFYSKNPNKSPFVFSAVFFLLFSCATSVSVLAYYLWPLMKFYRHIGYIAPLIKLYLCFLAGFGFEHLIEGQRAEESKTTFYKYILSGVMLSLISFFIFLAVMKQDLLIYIFLNYGAGPMYSLRLFQYVLMNTALLSLIGALVFYMRAFIKSSANIFIVLVLFLNLVDVYGYAFEQSRLRSFHLTQEQYALMHFQEIPFAVRRGIAPDASNPRERLVRRMSGSQYNDFNDFTFSDIVKPLRRSDYSLESIHQLLMRFDHDESSPVLLKLTGSTEDKIQFFGQAHAAKAVELSQGQRVKIPYQVTSFGPNEITIKVNAATHQGLWMEYCDLWHPFWKAQINGRPQKISIGNLAYKALPLEQGMNTVHFFIESKTLMFLYYFLMYSSLVWMIVLICLLVF